MHDNQVYRCGSCGAPLERAAGATVITCIYCTSENRLVSLEVEQAQARHARFAQAVSEAEDMQTDLDARAEALEAQYQPLQAKAITEGDAEAGRRATELFEGYMRLQYAPTLHIYAAADPDDPAIVAALKQIDEAIDNAVGAFAKSCGVSYTPTAQRLGSTA